MPGATDSLSSIRLRVDIRVPVGRPLPELAAFAAEVEAAGLDGIGVPDHHHTGRDAYLVLGAMAAATSRVSLYPATSNTVTRHPLVMAALASSLDELAPGRAFLTVAPGFLSVEKAGQARERRRRLREVVLTLRGLLERGEATFDGHALELFHRPAEGSRVLLLASGPRLLELAGEVADGVMMLVGLDPGGVSAAREHVRRGATRAGRDPADVEEILIVPFGVGPSAEQRRWVQGSVPSGLRSSARRDCCGRTARSGSSTRSCSRRILGTAPTTCPAPRSRPTGTPSGPPSAQPATDTGPARGPTCRRRKR